MEKKNKFKVSKQNNRNLRDIITISMTNYLEAGSIIAGSIGMTAWGEYYHLSSVWLGVLGAITGNAFGAAIGAAFGGKLIDMYGRKKMFVTHLIIYALGVLITIFTAHVSMLFLGFLITGIGVGIGVPASWTYLGEANDNVKRAARIGSSQLAWSIGPCLTFLVGTLCALILEPETGAQVVWLRHVLSNRIVFLHLFVLCLLVLYLQRGMKESDAWLAQQKAKKALLQNGVKLENPLKKLFGKKQNLKSLVFLVGVYLFWNLVAGAQGQFLPHILGQTFSNIDDKINNLMNALIWFLIALSTGIFFQLLGDKVKYRLMFFIGAVLAVLSWIMLAFVGAQAGEPAGMWLFVVFWGFSAGISAQAFYVLWATELFPTEYRGTAQGFMYFLVRGLIGVYSIVLPTLFDNLPFWIGGIIMIVFLVISLVIGTIWTPKTQGKTLKEIEKERSGDDVLIEEQEKMDALLVSESEVVSQETPQKV